MRRLIGVCVLVLLMGGSSFAVNVWTFQGTTFPATWDCLTQANWGPSYTGWSTSADNFIIPNTIGNTSQINLPPPAAGQERVFGEINAQGGLLYLPGTPGVLRFKADNGLSGSLTLTGSARLSKAYGTSQILDLDGNLIYNPTPTTSQGSLTAATITMRGVGVTYRMQTYTETYNQNKKLIIADCAVVNFVAPGAGKNAIDNIVIYGTATGPVFTSIHTHPKIYLGPNADTSNLDVYLSWYENDWGSGNGNPRNGNGMFITAGRYRDVDMGNAWNNVTATAKYTARMIGDVRARNLYLSYNASGGQRATYILDAYDNYAVATYNITTDCDVNIGRSSTTSNWVAGYNLRSSNVTVGRDLTVKSNRDNVEGIGNWIKATTATIRVGRNFTIENGTGFVVASDMGQSRMIFDGGRGLQTFTAQTIASKGVTLHDVFINNPNTGATVSLGANVLDDLTLSGSLEIDNGTFNAAGRRIYILAQGQGIKTVNGKFLAATTGTEVDFMGGGDNQTSANYLQLLPGDDLSKATVHVATGSPTVLQLLSDVTANGLRIDNGCAIVLNNHTLTIAGTNIPAGAYDMGNVYNTWADLAPVPEPGTMLLIGTATAGLLGWMRRRRMK